MDIYLKQLNSNIFCLIVEIVTHPHFNVITRFSHCGIEPWSITFTTLRSVEELEDTSMVIHAHSSAITILIKEVSTMPMFQACL